MSADQVARLDDAIQVLWVIYVCMGFGVGVFIIRRWAMRGDE